MASRAEAADPLISQGRPVLASSEGGSGYVAANAVDGNTATRWASVSKVDPQWIRVDLGSTKHVSKVELVWDLSCATAYKIQVSADGTTFTDAFSTTTGTGATEDITLDATGRYVRMFGTARCRPTFGYSLQEFRVFGSTPTTSSLISQGKPIKASSEGGTGYVATNANDGSTATRWASISHVDPQWIRVDLGAVASVTKVELIWDLSCATAYKIQFSNDDSTYSDAFTTTTGKGGTEDITVGGSARYVRMFGTVRCRDAGYSLQEFKVFGSGGGGGGGDTTPPSTPTSLHSTGTTSSSVSLAWTGSTDNVGVTGYEVFVNGSGTAAATSTGTSTTVNGLQASTTYSFTVKARDAAGNRSAASGSTTATTSASSGGDPTAAELLAKVTSCSQISNGKYKTDSDSGSATVPICGKNGAIFWKADMDIDCDGQRTSQCNENTDCCFQNDTAFHQSNGQPLNSAALPYFVIPSESSIFRYSQHGIQDGAVAAIIFNNKVEYAVFGDTGPTQIIGEASYRTAADLGINPDPSNGGVDSGVTYIVFQNHHVSPIESHSAAVTLGKQLAQQFLNNN